MNRGEVYRSRDAVAERGAKPGFYVVVSRDFVAACEDIATVVCAPVYSDVRGLPTEVVVGTAEGLSRTSSIRCDFLMLMFKSKLTRFVGVLPKRKLGELDRALAIALDLELPQDRP